MKMSVWSVTLIFSSVMCFVLLACVSATYAEDNNQSWRDSATQAGLSTAAQEKLSADRILFTSQTSKQIFDFYIGAPRPVFITSDSLLNAYHVLFEETVMQMEKAQADRLPGILKFIMDGLNEPHDKVMTDAPELLQKSLRRAKLVVGVAMKLVDKDFRIGNVELDKLIEEECGYILAASDWRLPEWFGKPEPGLQAFDYSRFKPRGFYDKSEKLSRYFRALSWLQAVPFRVRKDEEFLSILLLGRTQSYDRTKNNRDQDMATRMFFKCYKMFLGSHDDWDLMKAEHTHNRLEDTEELQSEKERFLREAVNKAKRAQINDQIRDVPTNAATDGKTAPDDLNFRIVSAYRLYDAVMFQKILNKRMALFPAGLSLAATVGSKEAEKLLDEELRKAAQQQREDFKNPYNKNLYTLYLYTISALFEAPDKDAPTFMSKTPWQRKSLNNFLSGWAQLRHTWSLQAKRNVMYMCGTHTEPGFVEPVPEFYSRFGEFVGRNRKMLEMLQIFESEADYSDLQSYLEAYADFLPILEGADDDTKREKSRKFMKGHLDIVESYNFLFFSIDSNSGARDFIREKKYKEAAEVYRGLAAELATKNSFSNKRLNMLLKRSGHDLKKLWADLELLCARLQALSERQLRGMEFSETDEHFLRDYGKKLAAIMLYGGNSYVEPKDDAPRVTDIIQDPNRNKHLHVGVGRPQAIYVLYPWKGKTVLCKGGVMPYYEFTNNERLTDGEWKEKLDAPESCPTLPEWLQTIVSTDPIVIPEEPEADNADPFAGMEDPDGGTTPNE